MAGAKRTSGINAGRRTSVTKFSQVLAPIGSGCEIAMTWSSGRSIFHDLTFRPYGAKWALRVKRVLESVIGAGLVDSLRVSGIRGQLTVTTPRRRTDEEIEDVLAANRGMTRERATYADEVMGHMLPMPWLEFDFHEKLMVSLSGPLKAFRQLVPEALASPKLKAEVKRFEGHEQVLHEGGEAVAAALRFLAEDNLRLVAEWIPKHFTGVAAKLRSWIGSKEHAELLSGAPK
jgi:hypothetical protein